MDLTVSDSEEEIDNGMNKLGKRVSKKPGYLNDYETGDYET
ncbi:hypothetical protein L195_g063822, partial [Trifolium pratense]